jgi:preprotein translocase subunit SecG
MMTFFLVIHTLLAVALVAVILMQRSEGGGLTGGSPGGLVSARGAGDLLTRTTAILATLFLISSLGLALLAANRSAPRTIDTSLARPVEAPAGPGEAAPAVGPLAIPAPAPAAPPADEVPIAN